MRQVRAARGRPATTTPRPERSARRRRPRDGGAEALRRPRERPHEPAMYAISRRGKRSSRCTTSSETMTSRQRHETPLRWCQVRALQEELALHDLVAGRTPHPCNSVARNRPDLAGAPTREQVLCCCVVVLWLLCWCVGVLLYCRIVVLRCCCVAVLLYCCVAVMLCCCVAVLLCCCVAVLLCRCVVALCCCAVVSLCCTDMLICCCRASRRRRCARRSATTCSRRPTRRRSRCEVCVCCAVRCVCAAQ